MNWHYRDDFPILKRSFYGKQLVYLDSAATTQKPQAVIDALTHYYAHENANVHRGIYRLSEEATAQYEAARVIVQHFLNASKASEIVFTRGTTESINLVAQSFGEVFIQEGDEIIISMMEHHSNIVPWQWLCERKKAHLKVIPLTETGMLDLDVYQSMLTDRVKLVSIVHVSNVLGVVNPVKQMIHFAHAHGIPVLVDGAQAVAHETVDVSDLDCDFYAFSSHKLYGPTGIGILYAKEHWLECMPPYQGGGDMIRRVTFAKTDYNVLPYKFEAGTPNMGGVAGLAEAIRYVNTISLSAIMQHEKMLYAYAQNALLAIPQVNVVAQHAHKLSVLSFMLKDIHPHDVATILDQEAIAVRAGHHCAMPLMDYLGLISTVRVSFGVYNDTTDIDRLCEALLKTIALFS